MGRSVATRREWLATAIGVAAAAPLGMAACGAAGGRPRAAHVLVPANAFTGSWTSFFSQISALGGMGRGAPTTHELELSFDPDGATREVTVMLEWGPPGGLLRVQGHGGKPADVWGYKAGEVQPLNSMGLSSPAAFLDSGALPRLTARYPGAWYSLNLQQVRPLAPSALVKPPVFMPDLRPAGGAEVSIFANGHLAWMFTPMRPANGGYSGSPTAMIVAE